MEALLATGLVGAFVYLFNSNKEEHYEPIENSPPNRVLKTVNQENEYRVNQYPVVNTDIKRANIQNIPAFPGDTKYSTGPLKTPFYDKSLEERLKGSQPVNLLDMSKRPLSDFKNNYFIPNKLKDTQNMSGTGVMMGNFDPSNYNMGADPSDVILRSNYGLAVADPTYMHKREVGPFFSPSDNATWIHGRPDIRPDLDRFKQDIKNNKHGEAPCEKVFYTGPGVGLDPSIPAAGGFNAGLNNRITPNNIFNYKVNQLPGTVISGKFFSSELPTALPGIGPDQNGNVYGVPNNKSNKTWITYEERPPVPLGISSIQGQESRPSIEVKSNNRSFTSGFGTLIPK